MMCLVAETSLISVGRAVNRFNTGHKTTTQANPEYRDGIVCTWSYPARTLRWSDNSSGYREHSRRFVTSVPWTDSQRRPEGQTWVSFEEWRFNFIWLILSSLNDRQHCEKCALHLLSGYRSCDHWQKSFQIMKLPTNNKKTFTQTSASKLRSHGVSFQRWLTCL